MPASRPLPSSHLRATGPLRPAVAAVVVLILLLLLAGCSAPADPEGTLDRARGGVLRVGATENDGWVSLRDDTEPQGLEPDLIEEFAGRQGAGVEWTSGSEQELLKDLEKGRLDVVIGGFADDTPWSTQAGMTRPYTEARNEDGVVERHVMLTRMGENALLLALDEFLLGSEVRP